MPINNAQLLAVVAYSPRIGTLAVPTVPTFQVRFNTPLDLSLVQTDAALNQQVILVRMDTDTAVPVVYSDWDSVNRILTFQPESALAPGAFYQITLRETLKNTQGRGMAAPRIWSFQVDASPLGEPELVYPPDSTAYSSTPRLQWNGVEVASGTVFYDVQLDEDWSFTDPLWSTTLSVAASGASGLQETAIGVSLTAERAYYWRVRARTASVSGDWVESWVFWLGSTAQAAPDTVQAYHPEDTFRVLAIEPDDGAANLGAWPTLRVTFSQSLDPDTLPSGCIQLWAEPVDGAAGTAPSVVSGSLLVDDATVEFVPAAETPDANTRYTLVLRTTVVSASGDTLAEQQQSYFTGPYNPIYGGIISVRGLHGACCTDVTDDQICFHLWRASIEVNRLVKAKTDLQANDYTQAELIAVPPATITYGMGLYAEYSAAISLLEEHYYTLLREAGKRTELGVFATQRSVEILPEIRAKLKELKGERNEIASKYLFGMIKSRVTQKSQLWDPCLAPVDRSYNPRSRF